ncbi:MAG TPA: hypothetical protein VGD51_01055 [Nocardioidaceae bacterium]
MASNLDTSGYDRELAEYGEKPEGPVAAAILAAGVGALALGVLTTLAEASEGFKELLTFSEPVGPLSGKTIGAVVIWLVAWVALHIMYRNKAVESRKELTISLVLIGLGVLGTFPIFFQAFAPPE